MITWLADRRSSFPPVVDQGQRGTCLAIALTAAHTNRSGSLRSAEYLHWASGNHPRGRGDIGAAAAALSIDGQPDEPQWLYDPDLDDADPAYAPPATVIGPHHTAAVRQGGDLGALQTLLESGNWPVMILRLTDAFRAGTGFVWPDGPGTAGHAVVVVGVATFTGPGPHSMLAPGELLVCVRNSWGPGWGANGHALISQAALTECLLSILVIEPSRSQAKP